VSGARGAAGDVEAYSRDVFRLAAFDEAVGYGEVVVSLGLFANVLRQVQGGGLLSDKRSPVRC
jgi:hypothetical protein